MKGTIKVNKIKIRDLMAGKRTNYTLMANDMGYSCGYVAYTISHGYMSKFLLESVAKQLGVKPEELLEEDAA